MYLKQLLKLFQQGKKMEVYETVCLGKNLTDHKAKFQTTL